MVCRGRQIQLIPMKVWDSMGVQMMTDVLGSIETKVESQQPVWPPRCLQYVGIEHHHVISLTE